MNERMCKFPILWTFSFGEDFWTIGRQGLRILQVCPRRLRPLLLQTLFSVRSARQFMEQISDNMLCPGSSACRGTAGRDETMLTKNRDPLLAGDIARGLLAAVLAGPKIRPLLSGEHFPADGTLLEAWASMRSFRPKAGRGGPDAAGFPVEGVLVAGSGANAGSGSYVI
jgi:hypothetical protein